MNTSQNKRRHARLVHKAPVRVTFSGGASEQLQMHDFSLSGLFLIFKKDNLPELGELIKVQTLEIDDAPILNTRVVRIVSGFGFGVEFMDG